MFLHFQVEGWGGRSEGGGRGHEGGKGGKGGKRSLDFAPRRGNREEKKGRRGKKGLATMRNISSSPMFVSSAFEGGAKTI